MQWKVVAEKVTGEPANEKIPSLNVSNDLASDGDSTYTLTQAMDAGVQRDQKSEEFTVSGS